MAQINTPKELFKHFRFAEDCKMQISQLHNTHREYFLRPFIGICVGINKQVREIIENEREYPEDMILNHHSTKGFSYFSRLSKIMGLGKMPLQKYALPK